MSAVSIRTAKARHNHRRDLVRAIALALCASAAHAGTYTVGTEAELIQAINDANANTGADTVDVTADIVLTAALPTITDTLTIEGAGGVKHALTRDDTGTNGCSPTATNAFRLIDASADLTLNDLTLSGGCNLVDQGGAVRVQNAALTMARSTISGNHTFYPDTSSTPCYGQCIGGGIAVVYGNAEVSDSTFTGNAVAQGYSSAGGGIAVYQGALTLTGSTVSGNHAGYAYGWGGGVYVAGAYPYGPAGDLTVANCTISGNMSPGQGGGLVAVYANVDIADSVIAGNQTGQRGAGIDVQNVRFPVTGTIQRTLIRDNALISPSGQGGFGGGMTVDGVYVTLELVDSTVAGNTVTSDTRARGGAIMIGQAAVTVLNSTLSGNQIQSPGVVGGGAIEVYEAPLSLYNSTITGNSSNMSKAGLYLFYGGETTVQPSAVIVSSIIAGNIGATGQEAIESEANTDSTVTADHSLIAGTIDVGIGSFTPDPVTSGLLDADPLLGPLAMNGGATPTQALAPESPAIDQGSNPEALADDQRGTGYPRVVGAATDIGAFEYDADVVFANGFD